MSSAKGKTIYLLVALAAQLGFAQAPLPTAWTGPWQTGVPPAGWIFSGLGLDPNPDYDGINNGAAKLDTTGDHIAIFFNGSAGAVTYWVKSLTFTGGVFRVDQSDDGTNWSALATYTELPATATFRTNFPSADARHIRFFYEQKGSGNVGLDGITIFAFVQPEIAAIRKTGDVVRVATVESMAGRTYALEYAAALTNTPMAWMPADTETGTGGPLEMDDLAPSNAPVRFYRVRDATPY
jgi:hypothetical protein